MKYKIIFFILLFHFKLHSQSDNLVKNGNFEKYTKQNYSRQYLKAIDTVLISVMKKDSLSYIYYVNMWKLPDQGTPDFYENPNICIDSSCVGIATSYLGQCGEFIEGKLPEPLVKDSLYEISMMIKPFHGWDNSKCDLIPTQMGISFSDTLIYNVFDNSKINYNYNAINVENAVYGEWTKIESTYKAKGKELYFVIGNFLSINYSLNIKFKNRIGYILLDNVIIKPLFFVKKKEITSIHFDIYFQQNDFTINPSQIEIINKVISNLTNDSLILIDGRIFGYASKEGDKNYNIELSKKRAETVFNVIKQHTPDNAKLLTVEAKGDLNCMEDCRKVTIDLTFQIK